MAREVVGQGSILDISLYPVLSVHRVEKDCSELR